MIPANLQAFIEFINIPFVNFNFIDIAILVIILIYAAEGYAIGFVRGFADFLSFVLSFAFALTFYGVFGAFLVDNLGMPKGISNAIGFFLAAFICEVGLTILFR